MKSDKIIENFKATPNVLLDNLFTLILFLKGLLIKHGKYENLVYICFLR